MTPFTIGSHPEQAMGCDRDHPTAMLVTLRGTYVNIHIRLYFPDDFIVKEGNRAGGAEGDGSSKVHRKEYCWRCLASYLRSSLLFWARMSSLLQT